MFARITEVNIKMEKKEDFIRTMKNEVLPILKKQHGFLETLPLVPEVKTEKFINVTLWTEKKDAERYERETFPRVQQIIQPYLTGPLTWRLYTVEATLCEHFVNALAA